MSDQENTELIEVVLGLLEKSKQQDESIQKAIKALESEKTALGAFRSDLIGQIGVSTTQALKEPTNALQSKIERISKATNELQQAKKDLDLRSNIWYFGGFAVFMAVCFGFLMWFVPSFDEIGERKAELEHLEAQIAQKQDIKNLDISRCNGKICVKVDVKQCNYGKRGQQYCIVK